MKSKINITYRDKDGNIIKNPEEGQSAYSPETKSLYLYTNGNWEMVNGEGGLKVLNYDINKQLIAQLNELDIEKAKETLDTYVSEHHNNYHMLLCRDINYYTLFNVIPNSSYERFSAEVISCLHDLGTIKAVDPAPDGVIEAWIHPTDEDPMVAYLFPYDMGVIQCTP